MSVRGLILFGLLFFLKKAYGNIAIDSGSSNEKASENDELHDRDEYQSIPGGGELLFIIDKNNLFRNSTEPIAHPENNKYYYINKNDSIIVLMCASNHIFDPQAKKCIKESSPQLFTAQENFLPYVCNTELKCKFHQCKAPMKFSSFDNVCPKHPKVSREETSLDSTICTPSDDLQAPIDCAIYYTCKTRKGDVFLKTRYKCPQNGRHWDSFESEEHMASSFYASSEESSPEYYYDHSDSNENSQSFQSKSDLNKNNNQTMDIIFGEGKTSLEDVTMANLAEPIENKGWKKNKGDRTNHPVARGKTRTRHKSSFFVLRKNTVPKSKGHKPGNVGRHNSNKIGPATLTTPDIEESEYTNLNDPVIQETDFADYYSRTQNTENGISSESPAHSAPPSATNSPPVTRLTTEFTLKPELSTQEVFSINEQASKAATLKPSTNPSANSKPIFQTEDTTILQTPSKSQYKLWFSQLSQKPISLTKENYLTPITIVPSELYADEASNTPMSLEKLSTNFEISTTPTSSGNENTSTESYEKLPSTKSYRKHNSTQEINTMVIIPKSDDISVVKRNFSSQNSDTTPSKCEKMERIEIFVEKPIEIRISFHPHDYQPKNISNNTYL